MMDECEPAQGLEIESDCCRVLSSVTISDPEAARTAELFKALAHTQRVKILNLLAVNPDGMCVLDISESLGLTQPNASHHLKLLSRAGLLTRQQCGTWAYYGLNHGALKRLSEVIGISESVRPAQVEL